MFSNNNSSQFIMWKKGCSCTKQINDSEALPQKPSFKVFNNYSSDRNNCVIITIKHTCAYTVAIGNHHVCHISLYNKVCSVCVT